VPSTNANPSPFLSGSNAGGTAVRIPMPGADRSTAAFSFEKDVAVSSGPIAATVSTCGRLAGYSSGLPRSSSLPEAATAMAPALTARWIWRASDSHRVADP
jgi:hypothetical protein